MKVESGLPAESINLGASHVLFVEGSDENGIDPRVFRRLLENRIAVRVLGSALNIRGAAQSLHAHHPNYYFLIDRDHRSEKEVSDSWSNFPDPQKDNLLIWKRRELENYFLEPSYLVHSPYLKDGKIEADIIKALEKTAKRRIFFDLANHTIEKIREEQKAVWIEWFKSPDEMATEEAALAKLKENTAFSLRTDKVTTALKYESIRDVFVKFKEEYLGGENIPKLGKGKWLERMDGKEILRTVINELFVVRDTDDPTKILPTKLATNYVAEDLLNKGLSLQPTDFQVIKKVILERLKTH